MTIATRFCSALLAIHVTSAGAMPSATVARLLPHGDPEDQTPLSVPHIKKIWDS